MQTLDYKKYITLFIDGPQYRNIFTSLNNIVHVGD